MKNESTPEAVLVVALYERPSDKKLFLPLVHSNKWNEPKWRIHGGGVKSETGEHPIAAAVRETGEEIGLVVEDLRCFDIITKPSRSSTHPCHKQHIFVGQVHSLEGFLPNAIDGDEILTSKVFPLEEVRASLEFNTPLEKYFILAAHAKVMKQVFKILFD